METVDTEDHSETDPTSTPAPVTRRRVITKEPDSSPESGPFAAGGELAANLAKMAKIHGKGMVAVASKRDGHKHIPTGIVALDVALLGGIPEGMITSFSGWSQSGKSTVAQRVIGNCQSKYPDGAVALIDPEQAYSPEWGAVHGIDNDRLLHIQPNSGESGIDAARTLLTTKEVKLVVVDSLATLIPMKSMERSAEDRGVGEHPRMINEFVSTALALMNRERNRGHWPTLLLVNQYRMKIGVFRGDPRTLPGGMGQVYNSAVRVELSSKQHDDTDERGNNVSTHNEHRFRIMKRRGNSLNEGQFDLVRSPDHPMGIGYVDDSAVLLTFARNFGMVTGGGSSWRMPDIESKFNTLQSMCNYLDLHQSYRKAMLFRVICEQRRAMGVSPEGWY